MFGRHPRLPIDVAMGVEPSERQSNDRSQDFVAGLRERLEASYQAATQAAEKSSARSKRRYDKKVRGSVVAVGDRVLVRHVGLRGKHKLANYWEDDVYNVIDQPDPTIPVFTVKKEGKHSKHRILHRNLLLPVNFLPLPVETKTFPNSPQRHHKRNSKPNSISKEPIWPSRTELDSTDTSDSDGAEHLYEVVPDSYLDPLAKPFQPCVSPRRTTGMSDTQLKENITASNSSPTSVLSPDSPTSPNESIKDVEEGQELKDTTELPSPLIANRPRRERNKPKWMRSGQFEIGSYSQQPYCHDHAPLLSKLFDTYDNAFRTMLDKLN
jgi:hypothetical protein